MKRVRLNLSGASMLLPAHHGLAPVRFGLAQAISAAYRAIRAAKLRRLQRELMWRGHGSSREV